MTLFLLMRRLAMSLVTRFGWLRLLMAVALHMASTYAGLWLAGERVLLAPETFLYFYLTTTTTVGYGDLSPTSAAGRLFVASWTMLGGIALITAFIGKSANSIMDIWRNLMRGKGDFSQRSGHTVLIGWQPDLSERVIDLLLQDETSNDDSILVCDNRLEENPRPEQLAFIAGESLTARALLERAGVVGAERILVHTDSDDQTLAIVLAVNHLQPQGHLVAHFGSSEAAELARTYVPRLECTSNMALEMLVRSSQDPGSSAVINELLSVGQGATQYCLNLPEGFWDFGSLYASLKQQCNATLIGYRAPGDQRVQVNPPSELQMCGGEIFYIADQRLHPETLQSLAS